MEEQFKVGDKVRVSVPRNSDVWGYDGEEGIVAHIHNTPDAKFTIGIKFDKYFRGMRRMSNPYNFSPTELEKIN